MALFRPLGAVAHEAHFHLAEIGVGHGLFIAHHTQLREQRRQLAGIEYHCPADRSALGGVGMEAFDDENSAGLEGSLENVRHSAASHIAEQDEVPAALAKVEVLHPLDLSLEA